MKRILIVVLAVLVALTVLGCGKGKEEGKAEKAKEISQDDLKVLEANEAAVRLAGFTRKEDLIGRKGLDLISPKYMGQRRDSKRLHNSGSNGGIA
jgi:PAS domain-containing protein